MPLKNGELNLGELKRLVKKYNELMSINTKGMTRPQVIQAIEKAGYNINHKEQKLELKLKQKVKKVPKTIKMPEKAPPKTQLQKQKAEEKKAEKEAMKKKQEREIRKKAVKEEKERQKKSTLKDKSDNVIKGNRKKSENKNLSNSKMGETNFIKQQKKLQLQKQKETRKALLKSKPVVDKTTRRGKPIKKTSEDTGPKVLSPKEYAPKDKPMKKKYDDLQDFYVDMRQWYEEYNKNITKTLDQLSAFFKEDDGARMKFVKSNPNVSKIIKQLPLNEKNIEKYEKLSFKI